MTILLSSRLAFVVVPEQQGNPRLAALGGTSGDNRQAGGNMEAGDAVRHRNLCAVGGRDDGATPRSTRCTTRSRRWAPVPMALIQSGE
jgi:hypothetical protein